MRFESVPARPAIESERRIGLAVRRLVAMPASNSTTSRGEVRLARLRPEPSTMAGARRRRPPRAAPPPRRRRSSHRCRGRPRAPSAASRRSSCPTGGWWRARAAPCAAMPIPRAPRRSAGPACAGTPWHAHAEAPQLEPELLGRVAGGVGLEAAVAVGGHAVVEGERAERPDPVVGAVARGRPAAQASKCDSSPITVPVTRVSPLPTSTRARPAASRGAEARVAVAAQVEVACHDARCRRAPRRRAPRW